jgi:glycosyltransferase involved in cell wall biosynthesis
MPIASPVYAIIIPAYNEAEELPVTLAAVRRAMAAQDLPGEWIVVDNNSSDDTAAVATAGRADRVVFEPVNQIARVRNAGAAAIMVEHLVFVDADTRIEAALLTKALFLLRQAAAPWSVSKARPLRSAAWPSVSGS